MNDYVGCVCSVCNKPFAAGDDIVVCPECGTPPPRLLPGRGRLRARSAARRGLCLAAAAAARPAGGRAAGQPAGGAPRVCPACGVQNRPGALFCENCGTPFRPARASGPGGAWGPAGQTLCAGGRARAGPWAARGRRMARLGRGGTACRQL
ncbi:MAG: RING finger protein [Ruthenibacterium sp.]